MRMVSFSTSEVALPKISDSIKTDNKLDVSKSEFKKELDQKVSSNLENRENKSVDTKKSDETPKSEADTNTKNVKDSKSELKGEERKSEKSSSQVKSDSKKVKELDPSSIGKIEDKIKNIDNSPSVNSKLSDISKKSVKKLDELTKKESLKKEDVKEKKSENLELNPEQLITKDVEVKDSDKKIKDLEPSKNRVSELDGDSTKSILDPTLKNDIKIDSKIKDKLSINEDSKKDKVDSKKESKVKVSDIRKDSFSQKLDQQEAKVQNKDQQNKLPVEEANKESIPDKTITLGTTELSAEGDGGKAQAPVIKEATTLLKQQLKDFGNNEIVKQTRFILKDKNVGEIKLILKPEALGEVKINLNLKQNSLAGHIVVENSNVREIFQENISSLSKALQDQGFDSADLQLSLSDKGEQKEREGRNKETKQYFSERLKRLDESGSTVRYGFANAGINLTA